MRKKKANWKQRAGMALVVVLGGAFGVAIASQGDHLGLLGAGQDLVTFYLPSFLGLVGAFYLQTLLHEAGHLVFGWISGYRFVSFRVGSLMLIRQGGRLALRRLVIPGTGGQCLLAPPEMMDGRFPARLYNLGGGLFNLASAALLLGLRSLPELNPQISLLLFIAGLLGLIIGLFNLIPIKTRMLSNDGHNALTLEKHPEALRALWLQLTINARLAGGQRLRDMPEDWFALPEEGGCQDAHTAAIAVIAANRLMDQERFMEADALMARLLDRPGAMAGLHRHMLACDRIYLELLDQNRDHVLSALDSPDMARFMKAMKAFPAVLRTRYAQALLKDADPEKAQVIQAQFDRMARRYPYPADIRAEQGLMDRAKARYQERERRMAEAPADLPADQG